MSTATTRRVTRAIAAGLLAGLSGCGGGGGSRAEMALPDAAARRDGYAALIAAAGDRGRHDRAAEDAMAGAASIDAYRAAVLAAVAAVDDPRASVAWTDVRPVPAADASYVVTSGDGVSSTIPGVHGMLAVEGELWIVLRPASEPDPPAAADAPATADDDAPIPPVDVDGSRPPASLAPVILPSVVSGIAVAEEERLKPSGAADASRDAVDLADVADEPAPESDVDVPGDPVAPDIEVDDLPRGVWRRLDRLDGRPVRSPDLAIAWLRLAGYGHPLRLTVTDPVTGTSVSGPAPVGPWRRLRWSDPMPPDVAAPARALVDPETGGPVLAEAVRVLPSGLGRVVIMRRAGGGRAAWLRFASFGDCPDPDACAGGDEPCSVSRAVREAVARAAVTSAIVLDLRGCGDGACHHAHPVLDRLLPASVPGRPVRHPEDDPDAADAGPGAVGTDTDLDTGPDTDTDTDTDPNPGDRYAGRLILIVDEGTAGPAEHLAAAFEPIREVTTIGVPTAGSRCRRVVVELPGGIVARIGGPAAAWEEGWPGHADRPVEPDVPLLVDPAQRAEFGPVAAVQTRSARQVSAGLRAILVRPRG